VRAKFSVPRNAKVMSIAGHGSYGKWVYHCHILEHEENDMMRPFEVVP
jgi:spore coat protein A